MKLAEALLLRAEYRDKLDNLHQRILANLKVQEGDAPHEDPKALLEESMELHRTMCALVQRIDRANGTICLPGGETLSQALAIFALPALLGSGAIWSAPLAAEALTLLLASLLLRSSRLVYR